MMTSSGSASTNCAEIPLRDFEAMRPAVGARSLANPATIATFLFLAACSGGGSGPPPNSATPPSPPPNPTTTDFPGGSIAALQQLDSNLTFDQLTISGPLTLPTDVASRLTVNDLVLSPTGSIVNGGRCTVGMATGDLDIAITGTLTLEPGSAIILSGGSQGNDVTCGCDGNDSGRLSITADTIEAASATLDTTGGAGTSSAGLGCAGGGGASLSLNATDIVLQDIIAQSVGGSGGTGSLGNGASGASGSIVLTATNQLTIAGGAVRTDGALTLNALQTDIFATVDYDSLNESIGGLPDADPPTVTFASPMPGEQIVPGQPLDVMLRLQDTGVGVREGAVSGFGVVDVPFNSSDFDPNTGLVTVTIDPPLPPTTLSVSVRDNKNNSVTDSINGLSFAGPLPPMNLFERESNDTFTEAQLVFINATVIGNISGQDAGSVFNPFDSTDDVEDLYRLEGSSAAQNFTLDLSSSNMDFGFDIDLYVAIDNGVLPPTFPAASTSPGTTETLSNLTLSPGETLYVGVSQFSPTLLPAALTSRPYTLSIIGN